MSRIDLIVESPASSSPRAMQLEGMFDVPHRETSRAEWHGDVDFDAEPWSIGLIVGPSGSGKTSIAREVFGLPKPFSWRAPSVIDDFAKDASIEQIAEVCQAVGFNTIPAWLRPYSALSNGEQFRVSVARALLETEGTIVIDEFTSVVDRQVAQIASYAVAKHVRRAGRQLVAVSCHYDIIDWLQPDWIFEPATMMLERRSVQPRPAISVSIAPVEYAAWQLFAPFHYLTADLNRSARCWCLFVDDAPAAFGGVLPRPHATAKNIRGLSRLVTLPDYQGLGLAFVLTDALASAHSTLGYRFHTYPAHPALVRSFDRSDKWAMVKRPGAYSTKRTGPNSQMAGVFGGRPNATFEWVGPKMDKHEAALLLPDAEDRS